ncbi:MAG: LysR family transcriptional regulator [Victivallaceae bacterium]|nr:LysR family transcriptional regulator [Victivallaceae bacterium]
MELSQIRYFVTAAETMHFALAAERLGVTQPSLSRGIQNLERELGVSLFIRKNKRNLFLSGSGKAFLPRARAALTQLELAARDARENACGDAGHLVIGALTSTLETVAFQKTLLEMQAEFPKIKLEIIENNSDALAESILKREIHIALSRFNARLFAEEDLIHHPLFADEVVIALPVGHRLAGKRFIDLKDLKNERIITVPERTSSAFYDAIRDLCRSRGKFPLQVAEECSNFYTALHLTMTLGGVTFVPASHEAAFRRKLAFCRPSGGKAAVPVYTFYWSDELPGALRNFLSILHRNFQKDGLGLEKR